jgi:hypothetical protein
MMAADASTGTATMEERRRFSADAVPRDNSRETASQSLLSYGGYFF